MENELSFLIQSAIRKRKLDGIELTPVIDSILESRNQRFALGIVGTGFGKKAEELANIVVDMLMPHKKFVRPITSDNGTEFAEHKKISKKLLTEFFFAHPHSSWERGLSEHTNKLARQYMPRKSIFSLYSEQEIKAVQHEINRRPRKNLNYDNPKNLFYRFVNQKVAFAS